MNNPETPYHNLTKIRGIGEARQKILRKQLDIYYYEDLIKLNIIDALSLLRKRNEAVSEEMLRSWVKEAELLVSVTKQTEPQIFSENGWQAAATFVIDYQKKLDSNHHNIYRTTVHHIQLDNSRSWQKIDSSEYQRWIKKQLSVINLVNIKSKKNHPHQFSALIKKVKFGRTENENIFSGKIELLLYIEKLRVDNDINSILCRIRCLLKKHHEEQILEFTQSCEIIPTDKAGYFLTSIDGVTVTAGEYFLWVIAVLNSPHSIPHFKELPQVTMNND